MSESIMAATLSTSAAAPAGLLGMPRDIFGRILPLVPASERILALQRELLDREAQLGVQPQPTDAVAPAGVVTPAVPRVETRASTSSKKTTDGAWWRARLKRVRASFSDSP